MYKLMAIMGKIVNTDNITSYYDHKPSRVKIVISAVISESLVECIMYSNLVSVEFVLSARGGREPKVRVELGLSARGGREPKVRVDLIGNFTRAVILKKFQGSLLFIGNRHSLRMTPLPLAITSPSVSIEKLTPQHSTKRLQYHGQVIGTSVCHYFCVFLVINTVDELKVNASAIRKHIDS
jgi:hypothetical protein